jgi:hypothetical protein
MKCNDCAEYGSAFCKDCLQEMKQPKPGHNMRAMNKTLGKLLKVIDKKDPPKPSVQKEEAPANSIAKGGVDMAPTMGPRKKIGVKQTDVTDRRYKKTSPPVLRRFSTFMKEK